MTLAIVAVPDYRARARRYAQAAGLDPDVFERQIQAESGFNPNARSPAGATGIAQIMPGTARGWGVDPRDPDASLRAAARNMAGYVRKYGGYENALRAYNAGPAAIERSRGYAETNAYVAKILRGRDPGRVRRVPSGGAQRLLTASGGGSPAQGMPEGQEGVSGLLAAMAQQQPRRSSAGVAPPAFMAQAVMPQGAQMPVSGGGPAPAPDMRALMEAIRTQGGMPQVPPGAPAVAGHLGAPGHRAAPLKPSGGYQGTQGVARQLASIGTGLGLKVTSEKRHNQNPYSGRGSDHDLGNKDAYAFDLSNGNRPTREMDQAAVRIARQLGIRDYRAGQPINRKVELPNGMRVQLIYRGDGAAFGGNHRDHIHLGVKRTRR